MIGEREPPLSVAVVTTSLSRQAGGLAESVPAGVNAVMKRGVKVSVLGLQDAKDDRADHLFGDADVRAVPSWPGSGFRFAPRLDQVLANTNPDLLHLQGLWQDHGLCQCSSVDSNSRDAPPRFRSQLQSVHSELHHPCDWRPIN